MTDDLLAFLVARLDEAEATAREAGSRSDHAELYVMDDDYIYPLVIGRDAVLADVEAKRAIAALHSGAHECSTYYTWGGETQINNCAWITDDEDCSTVRLLASAYRHHPTYRAEWIPKTPR